MFKSFIFHLQEHNRYSQLYHSLQNVTGFKTKPKLLKEQPFISLVLFNCFLNICAYWITFLQNQLNKSESKGQTVVRTKDDERAHP